MAPIQFLNLLAVSSLAILACSFGASPVTALVTDGHRIRDALPAHGHGAIAKRKRATGTTAKRCKPKPKSSTTPKPVSNPKDSSKKDSKKDTPKSSSTSSSAKALSTSYTAPSGDGKVGLAWANTDDPAIKNFKTDKVK
jgi:hypothetical protein